MPFSAWCSPCIFKAVSREFSIRREEMKDNLIIAIFSEIAPGFSNENPGITKYAVYAFITTMPKDDDNNTTCADNTLYSEKNEKGCPLED